MSASLLLLSATLLPTQISAAHPCSSGLGPGDGSILGEAIDGLDAALAVSCTLEANLNVEVGQLTAAAVAAAFAVAAAALAAAFTTIGVVFDTVGAVEDAALGVAFAVLAAAIAIAGIVDGLVDDALELIGPVLDFIQTACFAAIGGAGGVCAMIP